MFKMKHHGFCSIFSDGSGANAYIRTYIIYTHMREIQYDKTLTEPLLGKGHVRVHCTIFL